MTTEQTQPSNSAPQHALTQEPRTKRMDMNLEDGEIFKALAKAQGQMKNPIKDMTNPHFRSKYASLDSVIEATRKPLADAGLAFVQSVDIVGAGWVSITSMLAYGFEWIKWTTKMAADTSTPQKFGSSCTYARRYARMDIFGLAGDEDDDGNEASNSKPKGAPQRQPQSAPQPQQGQFPNVAQPSQRPPQPQPNAGYGDSIPGL